MKAAPSGFLSYRAQVWTDVDNARSGMLPWAFESGMGFERYVDYALDVPMYFVYRDGKYIDVAGKNFRDFLGRKIPEVAHITPAMSDWADHADGDDLSGSASQELPGNARYRWRSVAAHLRHSGALGGTAL